tara:strand:- start:109 stop:675 length:567 start_codon:yes stop_codon:yes gene_type:complete
VNRNVGIATAVGIAVIIGAISFQIYDSTYQRSTVEEYYASQDKEHANIKHVVYPANPQTLYGLTINKDKYLLGEKVFLSVQGIPMGLKDSLKFFTPNGILYLDLPFDGNEKSSFKHYFKPSLLRSINLCDKNELIGKWTINFAGTPNDKIYFQVTDEILPKSEEYYVDCNEARSGDAFLPIIEPSLGG